MSEESGPLNVQFLSENDGRLIRNIVYLTERRRVNPWDADEIGDFIREDGQKILTINTADGALAGFVAYREMPGAKRLEISDLQMAPEFAQDKFPQSRYMVGGEIEGNIDFPHTPKTTFFHLVYQLLGQQAEDVSLDFSGIIGDEELEAALKAMGGHARIIGPGDLDAPPRLLSSAGPISIDKFQPPEHGEEHGYDFDSSDQDRPDYGQILPFKDAVKLALERLEEATGQTWEVKEKKITNYFKFNDLDDLSPDNAWRYYLCTRNTVKNPAGAYESLRGIIDAPSEARPATKGSSAAVVRVPMYWLEKIVNTDMEAGMLKESFASPARGKRGGGDGDGEFGSNFLPFR
ncbi:MAG: hypothetical protein SFX19_05620 [Alphaproteobacteria bacterium]|nr:hypothetical protein [Alphaproteobacteria bacterium]